MELALWKTPEGQAVAVSCALLLVTLCLLCLLLLRRQPQLKLPPSPFLSLPLLGHIFHLPKLRSFAGMQGLRHDFGSILTLYVGRTPVIFIFSAALAHEALVEKGLLFAARPLLPSRRIFTNNYRSINSASYGPYWRAVRRNLVQEMLGVHKILSFKPVRGLVLDDMICRIRTEAERNEGVISVYPNIRTAMLELLLFMLLGFRMPEDAFLQMSDLLDELLRTSVGSFRDFYSYLHMFNRKTQQREHAVRAKQVRIYSSHFEKHKELKKMGQVAQGAYLETLLHMDVSTPLSIDDLVTLCTEFLAAGTDTTVTTLEWAMARLVKHPSIQSKLYKQIHEAVGDKPVEEKDLQNLPYLRAVVKETLRLHPPGQSLLPHSTSKLCTVGGYDIPPNAIVQFHVASISKDPEIWEEPLEFKPERFLASDVDITGSKGITMIPFGAGRRICPGLGLASLHLELFIARLVQSFEWTIFPSGATVDFTERFTLTVRMGHPLRAHVKERQGKVI